jgi:hypothetical protein
VGTFKRDYLGDAELRDAETVLVQFGGWFDDYNTLAPYSALGMRSPREYRALASGTPPHLPQDRRSTKAHYLGTPRNSGLSGPVRAANLDSLPEQKKGEHSTLRGADLMRLDSKSTIAGQAVGNGCSGATLDPRG